jgi:YggT family protein
MLSWFQGPYLGPGTTIIRKVTDPYLNFFRRFGLRIGHMDFSPVLAIITLSIVGTIVNSIAASGRVSLSLILAVTLSAISGAVGFFLVIFLVITAVRLGGILFGADGSGQFWRTLDNVIEPLSYRFARRVLPRQEIGYREALLLFGGAGLAVLLVGNLLVRFLITLILQIPI